MANRKIDFSRMVAFGPLQAHRWKFDDPGCPWSITAELWEREDGARMMEASIKAPVVQAAAALGGFMAFLAEFGAERDTDEQAKTRWALDYYSAKLKKPKVAAEIQPPKVAGGRKATKRGKGSKKAKSGKGK